MHIGKPVKRVTVNPRRVKRHKPLALPEPLPLTPLPAWWPVRKEEPATVPVRRMP